MPIIVLFRVVKEEMLSIPQQALKAVIIHPQASEDDDVRTGIF